MIDTLAKEVLVPVQVIRIRDSLGLHKKEIRTELLRKSIHFLIALVPFLASHNRIATLFLLISGTLFYTVAEYLRLYGKAIPFISNITVYASRARDSDGFVLGPVTLGIGASLALLLYPNPAAAIAIYTLAFGDGLASLVGKLWGRIRPTFMFGKSIEGSLACFVVSFYISWRITGSLGIALSVAICATLVEAMPLNDFDNIAIPVSVGLLVKILTAL